jgi:hypothetical protein
MAISSLLRNLSRALPLERAPGCGLGHTTESVSRSTTQTSGGGLEAKGRHWADKPRRYGPGSCSIGTTIELTLPRNKQARAATYFEVDLHVPSGNRTMNQTLPAAKLKQIAERLNSDIEHYGEAREKHDTAKGRQSDLFSTHAHTMISFFKDFRNEKRKRPTSQIFRIDSADKHLNIGHMA